MADEERELWAHIEGPHGDALRPDYWPAALSVAEVNAIIQAKRNQASEVYEQYRVEKLRLEREARHAGRQAHAGCDQDAKQDVRTYQEVGA
jgi:hypothetical protein